MKTTEKNFGLSSSCLKVIAIIVMFIDHFALLPINTISNIWYKLNYPGSSHWNMIYRSMRSIGRVALPIFAFLLVEGFLHTRDVKKYAGRLAIFCILSEIPFNLALSSQVFCFRQQNVMFTLLLGLIALICLKRYKEKKLLGIIGSIACLILAEVIHTDYGMFGVALIIILYLFKDNHALKFSLCGLILALLGISSFISSGLIDRLSIPMAITLGIASCLPPLAGALSFPLIHLYNGQKGRSLHKYFFYIFYPVHLFLLWLLSQYITTIG